MLLGEAQVGKSCLINQFTKRQFIDKYEKTIGIDFAIKMVNINDEIIKLLIFDCAGDKRFRNSINSFIKGHKLFFLVYDITRKQTFEDLKQLYESVNRFQNSEVIAMLIGNKIDQNEERQVTTEEGYKFAYERGIFFTETSAKKLINVEEAFMHAAKIIYEFEQNKIQETEQISKSQTSIESTLKTSQIIKIKGQEGLNE